MVSSWSCENKQSTYSIKFNGLETNDRLTTILSNAIKNCETATKLTKLKIRIIFHKSILASAAVKLFLLQLFQRYYDIPKESNKL